MGKKEKKKGLFPVEPSSNFDSQKRSHSLEISEGKGNRSIFSSRNSICLSICSITSQKTPLALALREISLVTYQYPTSFRTCPNLLVTSQKDWFLRMLMCRAELAVLLVIQAGVAATTCYKYSGQIGNSGSDDSGDTPCDPDAPVSACCGAGSICISNLHCYDVNLTTPNVPGTCTDQSFSDPACPCPPSE